MCARSSHSTESYAETIEAVRRTQQNHFAERCTGYTNRYNSIKVYGSTGVHTKTGSDFDLLGMAWQFRWGGGL